MGDLTKLRKISRKYRDRCRKLEALITGNGVTSFQVACIDDRDEEILCRFTGTKLPDTWVPKDLLDVGSEVWADGDESTIWVDSLWAYRKGLTDI